MRPPLDRWQRKGTHVERGVAGVVREPPPLPGGQALLGAALVASFTPGIAASVAASVAAYEGAILPS